MNKEKENALMVIWEWLQVKRAFQYVPWVLNQDSEDYDPIKAAVQQKQDDILLDLKRILGRLGREN